MKSSKLSVGFLVCLGAVMAPNESIRPSGAAGMSNVAFFEKAEERVVDRKAGSSERLIDKGTDSPEDDEAKRIIEELASRNVSVWNERAQTILVRLRREIDATVQSGEFISGKGEELKRIGEMLVLAAGVKPSWGERYVTFSPVLLIIVSVVSAVMIVRSRWAYSALQTQFIQQQTIAHELGNRLAGRSIKPWF